MSDFIGVVGYFNDPDVFRSGIDHVKRETAFHPVGYTPIPDMPAIFALNPRSSGVRWFSLVGGLTGIAAALALTIWTSWDYPLIVGGKPITALPPFLVVAFELMILLGSIASILGFLFMSRLPNLTPSEAYRPSLGVEDYALYIPCNELQRPKAEAILGEAGAYRIDEVNDTKRKRLQVVQ